MPKRTQDIPLRPYEMLLTRSLVLRKIHDMMRGYERLVERAGPDSPQVKRFHKRLDRWLDLAEKLKFRRDKRQVPIDRYMLMRNKFPGCPTQ